MSGQLPPTPNVFKLVVSSRLSEEARDICDQLFMIGLTQSVQLQIMNLFFLEGTLSETDLQKIESLICDPVTDLCTSSRLNDNGVSFLNPEEKVIEVVYRPGVTDNIARQLLSAASSIGLEALHKVAIGKRYVFRGDLAEADLHLIASKYLVNDTIQTYSLGPVQSFFRVNTSQTPPVETVPIRSLDGQKLDSLSRERRLALDRAGMRAIQTYFLEAGREPRDAELETLAQTWSEHCVHKTFNARITLKGTDNAEVVVDGLIKSYLRAATRQINAPWVKSAFIDNAGIIAFDDSYDLSFKVETHNHPSALEPFGGANTGVGGVVRDVLGVSHRPIANAKLKLKVCKLQSKKEPLSSANWFLGKAK